MKERHLIGAVAAAVMAVGLSAAAQAGIYYEATTRTEGDTRGAAMTMAVKAWVSGEQAKVEFTQSDNPFMAQGNYLLTTDGGKTLYLVNPSEKTYTQWDLEKMMGMAGGMMKMARGIMHMTFSDPKVEKLGEEDGGTLLGMPTTHYTYRTSYSVETKILGMRHKSDMVNTENIWATDAMSEAALGVWLRKTPPKTGDEQLDKLVAAEVGKIKGFPLKQVTVATTTDSKGKTATNTTTMEVTALEKQAMPDGTFVLPAGYRETQMVPEGEGKDEGSENPMMKLFGGKKKP